MNEAPETRSTSPLFILLLGLWLGGSLLLWFVVVFNFAGFPKLFERNPPLSQRAGFDLKDENAKKASLLWVHASELNRVYFEVWGQVQLGLGGLALAAGLIRRQSLAANLTAALALGLAALISFYFVPEIIQVGRTLDFTPREPPPPQLAQFQRLHGFSTAADGARILLLAAAAFFACLGKKKSGA